MEFDIQRKKLVNGAIGCFFAFSPSFKRNSKLPELRSPVARVTPSDHVVPQMPVNIYDCLADDMRKNVMYSERFRYVWAAIIYYDRALFPFHGRNTRSA